MPLLLFAAALAVWPVKGSAQEDYEHNLARERQNPLSPLITVPLLHNWDFKMGPLDQGKQYRLVFQPSFPISLNEDWRLITRVFVPYISQEDVLKGPFPSFPGVPESLLEPFPKDVRKAIEQAAERQFNRDVKKLFPVDHHQDGLSDITQNIFFSPTKPAPGGIIWGIGPVLRFPTATDHRLGRQQWGAGPALALVKQTGPWSFVIGAEHLWSLHGKKDREDLNTTLISSVVSYTTQKQFTVGVDADAFYEWSTNQWLVPINFEVSQIVKVGDLPVQFLAGVRYYVNGPSGAPEWGLRFTIAPIFREWIKSAKKKTER
ncbi:hypothetical protein ACXR0O_25540 [Verrucomicrobiota bacterium sgz303538]